MCNARPAGGYSSLRMRTFLVLVPILAAAAGATWWFSPASSSDEVQWIVHYAGEKCAGSLETHVDLVKNAPPGVRVLTVVGNDRDEATLREALRDTPRYEIVRVQGSVTPWARDRYIVFQRDGRTHCLMLPAPSVPEIQRGDAYVPDVLRAKHPDLKIVRSEYAPQGGDVIVTKRGVIVGMRSIASSAKRTGTSPRAVIRELEQVFGRRLIVVGHQGHTNLPLHVDIIMANAGKGRILLTDPRLLPPTRRDTAFEGLGAFPRNHNLQMAVELENVAAQLKAAGFEVSRVAGLFGVGIEPGQLSPTVLTYTNVIREGRRVFVPAYGLPELDRAAQDAWLRLGFEVVPIRARSPVINGGAVRCMTNRFPGETDI